MTLDAPTVIADVLPLNLDVNETARVIGCSRSTVYELLAAGELPSKKLGTRRLIPYAAVVAYDGRLPSA